MSWVFSKNSNFLIPISLQPDGVNLWYLGYKNTGIRKSEFVAKTQFLWKFSILDSLYKGTVGLCSRKKKENWQRLSLLKREKVWYLPHCYSDTGLNCTLVNRAIGE